MSQGSDRPCMSYIVPHRVLLLLITFASVSLIYPQSFDDKYVQGVWLIGFVQCKLMSQPRLQTVTMH